MDVTFNCKIGLGYGYDHWKSSPKENIMEGIDFLILFWVISRCKKNKALELKLDKVVFNVGDFQSNLNFWKQVT